MNAKKAKREEELYAILLKTVNKMPLRDRLIVKLYYGIRLEEADMVEMKR